MKTAVFACVLAVMAVAACAQTPCCGPRQISQLQFGLSTMNADAQGATSWFIVVVLVLVFASALVWRWSS